MSEEAPAERESVSDGAGPAADTTAETADADDGRPVDERDDYSELEDRLALYEWVGGLIAALGFFLTPIFTTLPAGYCALRIRQWKPISAMLILALVATTIVFWLFVVWVVLT